MPSTLNTALSRTRRRVVSPLEFEAMDDEQRREVARLLRLGLVVPPLAGGDGEDDDADADADADRSGDDDDGDEDDEGEGDDGEGDDDDGDDEAERRVKAAERRAKAAEAKARKAERKLRLNERQRQAKQGEYKQLYEDEKQRNGELERRIREGARDRAIVEKARDAGFKNPELAVKLLGSELNEAVDEDGEVDDDLVERSVKKLAKRESYLIDKKRPQGDVDTRGDRERERPRRNGNGNGSEQRDDRDRRDEPSSGEELMRMAFAETRAGDDE